MMWPQFDLTINVSNIFTILGGAWIIANKIWRMHRENQDRLEAIEQRQRQIEGRLNEHADDELDRLKHLDDCLDEAKQVALKWSATIASMAAKLDLLWNWFQSGSFYKSKP